MVRVDTHVHLGAVVVAVVALLGAPVAGAQQRDTLKLDQIPAAVMNALRARFPAARITQWTREVEGDTVLFDIEFTRAGRKLEADIREDGSIHNWEQQIAAGELPAAVRRAVERKYPGATFVEVMRITAVSAGRDALAGYEIVLKTAGGKDVEVTVAPDGRIVEDSGDQT